MYSEYLDKRSREEIGLLFGKCLDLYVEGVNKRGEKGYCVEYPIMRGVLKDMSK